MIDRATLLKIAADTAAQRLEAQPSLLSAYLTGSVAADEPLLGDATDIDLIFIDVGSPPSTREVIRLTDQVVIDIQHRGRADYANPKALRVHPWRGPEMCEPIFLRDPQHFFEIAQASARGQFHRPDHVAARARAFAQMARDELHVGLLPGAEPAAPVTLANLCRAGLFAANAAITLTGFPGAGRRLPMKLEAAARSLGRADLFDGFVELYAPDLPAQGEALRLLDYWTAAYLAGQTEADELIHPARRTIYQRGFQAQIQADRCADVIWLMLYTWQAAVRHLPGDSPHAEPYAIFLQRLNLASPADFGLRVGQARDYVAVVDAQVEAWAEANGA